MKKEKVKFFKPPQNVVFLSEDLLEKPLYFTGKLKKFDNPNKKFKKNNPTVADVEIKFDKKNTDTVSLRINSQVLIRQMEEGKKQFPCYVRIRHAKMGKGRSYYTFY